MNANQTQTVPSFNDTDFIDLDNPIPQTSNPNDNPFNDTDFIDLSEPFPKNMVNPPSFEDNEEDMIDLSK